MNGINETKSEIRARIEELIRVRDEFIDDKMGSDKGDVGKYAINHRISGLEKQLELAEEDLSSSIIRSHKALCKAKMMDEKAAYGNDPAVYYTLGVCAESGEMANAIVKSLRNGSTRAPILDAIKSELPDVIIYSYILAYVLDIDLSKLVNEKVEIVIQRAINGYYGGPLSPDVPGSLNHNYEIESSPKHEMTTSWPANKAAAAKSAIKEQIPNTAPVLDLSARIVKTIKILGMTICTLLLVAVLLYIAPLWASLTIVISFTLGKLWNSLMNKKEEKC